MRARRWDDLSVGPRAEQTPPVASLGAPVAQLWAGDLRVDHVDDALSISLGLEWDGPTNHPGLPSGRRLQIEVRDLDRLGCDRRLLLAAQTPPNATALVPLLAAIAATTGADLTIEAPVCPTALAGARRAIAVGQVAHGWAAVTVGATAGTAGPPQRGGDGVVFSLDLESLATLVELRKVGRAPTHLLAVDRGTTGGDSPSWCLPQSGYRPGDPPRRSWRTEAMAANAARLPLVRAGTNVGELDIPGMTSSTAEQAVTAACALALAGVVGSVTLPGGRRAAEAHAPDTTSLWSSATVHLGTPAPQASVTDAANLVASDAWALQWLRVCSSTNGDRNCGECEPCQFTLATLWLARASAADLSGFDHGVDVAVVRALHPGLHPGLHRGHQSRHDHLELIDRLAQVADGRGAGDPNALQRDRYLAAALADAWAAHLERVDAWAAHLELGATATGTHALSA